MKYMRTFATEDGGSSMEEISVEAIPTEFVPGNPSMGVSEPQNAGTVKFLQVDPGWDGGWHPSPARQYMVPLTGGFRVETTDGQAVELRPGDLVLLDDTSGKGHHTTMLDGVECWIAVTTLD
ncbi:MAG: hypothetical protein GKS02_13255 [Alphaproteobacteria bacterium]|nr:hypothetical protein [Alphaproteobacteria bacterium]